MSVALDRTSKFEISTVNEGAPVTDSYDVVLTGVPSIADVIVNIQPKPTRTYNADKAFDPAADYGENTAVQVRTATPRARFQLTGAAIQSERWTITLEPVAGAVTTVFVDVTTGQSLDSIANAFVTKFPTAGYTAAKDGTGAFYVQGPGAFYASLKINKDTLGGATWDLAGSTLFYTTVDDSWRPDKVWRHVLGTPVEDDVVVHHETDERFWTSVGRSRSDRLLVIGSGSKTTTEYRILDAADPTG